MGLEDLTDDPRFVTNAVRVENRALLDDLIAPMFASKPTATWLQRLREADILCGPINDFVDVAADPNLTANLPLVDPLAPNVPQAVGVPIRRNGAYTQTRRPAPAKAEHTQEILREFGFEEAESAAFLSSGAAFIPPSA